MPVSGIGLNNNLKDKVGGADDVIRTLSRDSIGNISNNSIGFDISENEGTLTQNMLKQHDILEAKNESKQYLKGFNVRDNKIKEEISEDEQDDEEMKIHEQKRRANRSASRENFNTQVNYFSPTKFDDVKE